MKIKFVDLARQNKIYKKKFMHALEEIVSKAEFTMGKTLQKFEKNFANFCGKKYCIGVNSGTDALKIALIGYGVSSGDEVITVPNSYFSTAAVISEIGAIPIFVDINKRNYTIDTDKIEAKITNKTRLIIPVHLYGHPADMKPILKLANRYKLKIIEDCCQAHGAKYEGKRVPYTETGVFSFYPGKNLGGFGDGGAIVTDNNNLAMQARYLRNDGSIKKYYHNIFGFKSRLHSIHAAILNVKLPYLSQWNKLRRRKAKLYNNLLKNIADIKTPIESKNVYHVYHLYVIEAKLRDQLREYLAKEGVATNIHYPIPIHLQKPYKQIGFKEGDFPITERLAKKILSLPLFPEITDAEIKYISRKIKDFYSK